MLQDPSVEQKDVLASAGLAYMTDEECEAIVGGDGNAGNEPVTIIEFTEDEVEPIEVPAPPPIGTTDTSTTT